jgi:glycosyltransferase involved in cell wall biosynthesis
MVSVIVPLFNKAPYVQRAIDSIVRQTHADFELIVVDDGSTDGGDRLVEAMHDPRLRLIRQSNAGPGAARNTGIAAASGSLLAFLDADDEWMPTFLERNVALIEAEPQAAAIASAFVRDPPGVSTAALWERRGLRQGGYRLEPQMSPAFVVQLLAFMCWPCALIMRSEVVRRFGGFYEHRCTYGEDSHLMLKVMLREQVIVNLESLVVYHVDASALNRAASAPRGVEAFLQDPSELYDICPPELRALLDDVLAARALKTACVLTYWGQWREGRALTRRFSAHSPWRLPFFAPAQLGVNPLGAAAAAAYRSARRLPGA